MPTIFLVMQLSHKLGTGHLLTVFQGTPVQLWWFPILCQTDNQVLFQLGEAIKVTREVWRMTKEMKYFFFVMNSVDYLPVRGLALSWWKKVSNPSSWLFDVSDSKSLSFSSFSILSIQIWGCQLLRWIPLVLHRQVVVSPERSCLSFCSLSSFSPFLRKGERRELETKWEKKRAFRASLRINSSLHSRCHFLLLFFP